MLRLRKSIMERDGTTRVDDKESASIECGNRSRLMPRSRKLVMRET